MIVIKIWSPDAAGDKWIHVKKKKNVIEKQTSLNTIFILMVSAYIPKGGTDNATMTV